ncbi:hypothetical protein B0H66DRAFT_630271 [Apodospora peruviana]|uniref:NmrA-like domain-containing protein n=1 Tax=Apodospora peruviana TaxID=516989 RepID=A0AAE0HW58_9PEZI|nr:hypothetical protein B0H66DRAFT_630271 [Apodospora peruviana]
MTSSFSLEGYGSPRDPSSDQPDPKPDEIAIPGTTWKKVDYQNATDIAVALSGVDTVLSFIIVYTEGAETAQKNLIDASIKVGVKRFAPSEWSCGDVSSLSWYVGKQIIRDYLVEVNKMKKVLEYTLFQPGLMMEYYTWPYVWHKYIKPLQIPIEFSGRRAILVQDQSRQEITFTSVDDIVRIVTKALEYKGKWPLIGGISGNKPVSMTGLISLGEKIRGKPWTVDKLRLADVQAGVLNSTWIPMPNHNSVANMTQEEREAFGKVITKGMLLSFGTGAWKAADEWNRLVGGKYKSHKSFLEEIWAGKP